MISLLLAVFLVQLVIYLINTFGASAINDLLWLLYQKIPLESSKHASEQLRLRGEVLRLKREMNAISSQDQFAKWAKIRRQHDKAQAAYDEKTASVKETRSSFDMTANGVRWVSTNGVRLFLQFYHTKTPLFWYPRGWMPWYVERILSFPRAPNGSVSIQVWGAACVTVIGILGELIGYGITRYAGMQGKAAKRQPMAQASGSGPGDGEKKDI